MNTTKKRMITHKGELDLAGYKLPCYVLEDGTRILSGRGIQEALKMVDEAEKGKETAGNRLDRYLNQPSIKPFIYKDKKSDHYDPIISYDGEKKIHGYKATLLPDFCDGILEARKQARERKKKKDKYLPPRQEIIAKQCEIIIRAFARVGIIALVDEATGYQKVRDDFELQKILKAYISEETLEWQKTFHDGFYEQLYRLWKKTPSPKRPWFFGTLTNELVYKKLPKGVLEALKIKTPKSKRLHQSLTPEIGKEHLKKQIHSVEALAKVSKDKNEFSQLIEKHNSPKDKQPIQKVNFDKALKIAINTPPLKLKDLKAKLKKDREEKN